MPLPPFDRLIDEHGPTCWRVCRALLPAADADDAWADTFVAAWQAYPTLRDSANLRGWLVTIAHHKSIDHLRRHSRTEPAATVPDRPTHDQRTDLDLFDAVRRLPDRQRAAVALHYLGDLRYAAVADLLGVSEAAARRAAADGIAKLRSHIAKENS